MDSIKFWLRYLRGNSPERRLIRILAAITVLFLIVCIFAAAGQISANRKNSRLRTMLGETLYSDLNMLTQTFDMTDIANADLQGVVLPQMRRYFDYACAVNDALAMGFGSRYSVLTGDDTDMLDNAFTAYENAFRQNQPTDSAKELMGSAIAEMRQRMQIRFSDGKLKRAR